ncbi:MAG TPA: TetR family transcriptional regulator [Candidatus Handelsmanbacteria bacterium]|nr:TetR family transcriptional regulator [Candidatus Handelsmanbacteria bacterium]
MRYRRFGRTELQVSAVSLGGAYLRGDDPDRAQENAREVVGRALDLGCNYIDTAPLYGESETLLGGALAGETRPFYLATKVGFKPEGFDYRRDSVLRSLERSLGLLGRSKLTVAQIHEAAGISKGGFYHHFTSKEDVLTAVLMRLAFCGSSKVLA